MQPVVFNIEEHNVRTLIEALGLYSNALGSVPNPNETIKKELRYAGVAIQILYAGLEQAWGMPTITMDRNLWELTKSVGVEYLTAKSSKLELVKAAELVNGSTDQDQLALEQLSGFLDADGVKGLEMKTLLVKSFSSLMPSDGDMADKMTIQVQAGNVYGQLVVAGTNNGSITQNNSYTEIYKTLDELTAELSNESNDILPETRSDALGDIQSIQAQLTKSKPSKSVIDAALKGLSVVADAAQVGQVAVTLAPHVHTLTQLLSQIHL
jgi:hypothetical protein